MRLPAVLTGPGRLVAVGAAAAAIAALAAGCGGSTSGSGGGLDVVATTTQLADLVRNVGGTDVDVHQILKPNTDPHEYEPRPGDVQAAADARVVLLSGDDLDRWMGKVIDESGGHPRRVTVADSNVLRVAGDASGPEASRYDPHWWHAPVNVIAAIPAIRDALTRADPRHAGAYRRRAGAYEAKVRALDRGIKRCFARVPRPQRKLVTSHDAFNYLAREFGVTVVGAIIPSQTTQAQPSAASIARLVAQVRRQHVRAVFLESSVNPKLAQAVARETHTIHNLTLYGDTLGPAGSAGDTYLGMERANADAMVRGFSGGRARCPIAGV
jgi:zinc/manganese transport system substrate-binding protein